MATFDAERGGGAANNPLGAAYLTHGELTGRDKVAAASDNSLGKDAGIIAVAPQPPPAEAPQVAAAPLLLVRVAAAVLASPCGLQLGVAIGFGLAAANFSFLGASTAPLRTLAQCCRAVGDVLLMLPLFSLRRVTRGAYWESLGAGSVELTAEATSRLGKRHGALLALALFMALGYWGMFNIVWVGILGIEDPYYVDYQIQPGESALTVQQRLHALLLGLYAAYVAPLVYCAWYFSLNEASELVRAEVAGCRERIDKTAATSDEWDAEVVPVLIKLSQETLPALSKGWADGLLAVWAGLWVTALGTACKFLHTRDLSDLVLTAGGACAPLVLAADVAGASSACDKIMGALNARRAADLSYDNHCKLEVVETLLSHLNKGQGLGFVVSGKVLDRSNLRNIFAGLVGFLGTALPLIFALQPVSIPGGEASGEGGGGAVSELFRVEVVALNLAVSYHAIAVGVDAGQNDEHAQPRFTTEVHEVDVEVVAS